MTRTTGDAPSGTCPTRAQLGDEGAPGLRLIEPAVGRTRVAGDPFGRGQRIVGRTRRARGRRHETQLTLHEGSRGGEHLGLLTDQPVQIELTPELRRRVARHAKKAEHGDQHRRRQTPGAADGVADAVKIAQRDAGRIGAAHLRVGQIEAIGEELQHADFLMPPGDDSGAYFSVEMRPEKIGAETRAEHDDDQVEARHVVVRGPCGTGMRLGHHHPRPGAAAVARAAGR